MKRPVQCICFFLFAFAVTGLKADILPDDHGNNPLTATPMSGSSNTVSGVIDYDTDVDVYSFPFLPWRSYVISVHTNTVFDLQLSFIPPDLSAAHWSTNTARSHGVLEESWSHTHAAARWYLEVSGLFQFTTGAYHIAVWEEPGQDLDGDGLSDSWELFHFGSLTNANAYSDAAQDGFTDYAAYLAGLAPTQTLAVQSFSPAPLTDVVSWNTAAYGHYDLFTTTNLTNTWSFLHRHISGATGGSVIWTNAPTGDPIRFYRVVFHLGDP